MYDLKDFPISAFISMFLSLLFLCSFVFIIHNLMHSRLGFNLADLFTALISKFDGSTFYRVLFIYTFPYHIFLLYIHFSVMHSHLGFNLADLYTALVSTFGGTTIFIALRHIELLATVFIKCIYIG